jgi:integrase
MSVRKRKWKGPADKKTGQPTEKEAWVVDYVDQVGKRRLKTFARKKEAEEWAVTAQFEVRQGVHTPARASATVTEATELWIADCEANGLEYGTIKQRREHLKLHIAPFIGREKLSDLTTPRINRFLVELRDNGRSLAMRRKVLANLKTILSFAQGQGLVAQNVARSVRVKGDNREAGDGPVRAGVDFPNRKELNAIITKTAGRWRPFALTAMFTGMRASELRGLTWADVDLDQGVIHVRRRADQWRTIGKPKSKAGSRDIPLAPMVVNALREWQGNCPRPKTGQRDAKGRAIRESARPEHLVFPSGAGNVESHQNMLNRFWHPFQVEQGMTVDTGEKDNDGNPIMAAKYGLHALRHAAASLFIAHLRWQPKRVQTVMGHANITTTFDLYGHLFEDPEGDRESMKQLEAAVVAA